MKGMEVWRDVIRAIADCIGAAILFYPMKRKQGMPEPEFWREREWPTEWWYTGLHAVGFILFTAMILWVKLSHLIFWQDILLMTAVITAYLMCMYEIRLQNAIYIACVTFLCTDFCVALANSHPVQALAGRGQAIRFMVEAGYTCLLAGLCFLVRKTVLLGGEGELRTRDFLLLSLAFLPYLAIRTGTLLYQAGEETEPYMEVILLLTMAATFGTLVGNRNALLAEKEKARRLALEMQLKEKEQQFLVRKETVDEVRRKYHDMVKYARLYDETRNKEDAFADFLEKRMVDDLRVDSFVQTGNHMLDMILWERMERCREKGIRLLPMVTGDALSFVEDYDILTIVGNALDNAIEAAEKLDDPEKKEISLRIQPRERMVFVHVANYFAGTLKPENDGFSTTKQDPASHGYGLRNIRQAAEAYDGALDVHVEGDRFVLTVMLTDPGAS